MGCFKAVLGKLKKDVHKKMGNMPVFKMNDKFEKMNEERCSKKSLSASLLPDWMEEPKIPMDFSSGVGKLVGPDEALGEDAKPKVLRFEQYEHCPPGAFANGVHKTQKYYHGKLTRQNAEAKLQAAGTNGSWLLRESSSRSYCLIISYIYEGRCHHKYISVAPYVDQSSQSGKDRIYVATLDHILAFYDIHTLLEFYRLNYSEEMSCMLGISVKNSMQPSSSPARSKVDVIVPEEQMFIRKPFAKSQEMLAAGFCLDQTSSATLAESGRGLSGEVASQVTEVTEEEVATEATEATGESLSYDPPEHQVQVHVENQSTSSSSS